MTNSQWAIEQKLHVVQKPLFFVIVAKNAKICKFDNVCELIQSVLLEEGL